MLNELPVAADSSTDDLQPVSLAAMARPRRRFLTRLLGLGAGAATMSFVANPTDAQAQGRTRNVDLAIVNFALNLEYLEGEFYSYAVFGQGIAQRGIGIDGTGRPGPTIVKANPRVPFRSAVVRQFATELVLDELAHVTYLRDIANQLGVQPAAKPAIDLLNSFKAAGQLAGLGNNFDPYASEINFLLGSYIFEDVGVTAYNGAAPLITSRAILAGAASVLAVEAYHAGALRTLLFERNQGPATEAISGVRRLASGENDDYGVAQGPFGNGPQGNASIVLVNPGALAFSRTVRQVLNIVYLSPDNPARGGFFPNGMNGQFR